MVKAINTLCKISSFSLIVIKPLCTQSLSHVWLFVTPWTVAHQAPLAKEFFRQEHWSGLPFSSPGDLPNPGIKSMSRASSASAGGFFTTVPPGKPIKLYHPSKSKTNVYHLVVITYLFIPLVISFEIYFYIQGI